MTGATDRLAAWFPVLLLSALAGLTYWIDLVVQPPAPARIGPVPHDPDVIVDRMTATRMGPDGRVKHTLIAARMIHYPDDDTTHLASPRFVSYDTRGTPLTITSNEGLVSSEGENVYFKDDVRVVRAPYDNKSELEMRTSFLHVIPDENIAKTDRPATITDANSVVNAIGLELNGDTRILKLHDQVKGSYARNRK